jgi:hypothetical protein
MEPEMKTAKNDEFLRGVRKTWNAKIYVKVRDLYNTESKAAAANYLQQFVTTPVEGATVAPPKPPQLVI